MTSLNGNAALDRWYTRDIHDMHKFVGQIEVKNQSIVKCLASSKQWERPKTRTRDCHAKDKEKKNKVKPSSKATIPLK